MKALEGSINCPNCGSDHKAKCFFVYENGYHCFSCGYSKQSDRGFMIPREIQAINTNFPELGECIKDPNKFSISCLMWLAKYHITSDMIKKWNIMQFPDDSLVYLNMDGKDCIGYQRRWIGGARKIITKGPKIPSIRERIGDVVVLVEDYLSYIRVSSHVSCVCLWGTKISYNDLKNLFNKYSKCLVWLDNDSAKQTNSGQESALKICKMAESVIHYKNIKRFSHSQGVHNIVTQQDPKCFTDTEIKKIIQGVL